MLVVVFVTDEGENESEKSGLDENVRILNLLSKFPNLTIRWGEAKIRLLAAYLLFEYRTIFWRWRVNYEWKKKIIANEVNVFDRCTRWEKCLHFANRNSIGWWSKKVSCFFPYSFAGNVGNCECDRIFLLFASTSVAYINRRTDLFNFYHPASVFEVRPSLIQINFQIRSRKNNCS